LKPLSISAPGRQSARALPFILVVLLVAAGLRIVNLTRLPPGFNEDEIKTIQATETARLGTIASFYNVGDPAGGYEGLFPILQAVTTSLIGDGLLCYRVLSVWSGLISIAMIYALGRRLFGSFAGIGAALALAVSLWPVLLSRSTIREALLLPVALGTLLVMTRALHLSRSIGPESPSTIHYTLLGLLIAGMIYTHWAGLVIIPLFIAFIVYLIVTHQPISRRVLSFSGFTLLVVIILGIPYLTFTLRSVSLSGLHVYWANRPPNGWIFIANLLKTLLSLFWNGDVLPQHNIPGWSLLGPISAILFIVGLAYALRHLRTPNMGFLFLAFGIGILPGAWTQQAPNFAAMTVALPAIMAFVGIGAAVAGQYLLHIPAADLLHDRRAILAVAAITVITIVLLNVTLFQQWNTTPAVEEAYRARLGRLATYLDRVNDDLTTSICTLNLRGENGISDPVLMSLMLHRRTTNLRFSDCTRGLVLTRGGSAQRFAFAQPEAMNAVSPFLRGWLQKAQPVQAEGLPAGTVLKLNVEQELADTGGQLAMRRVRWAPESDKSTISLPIRMGGYLTFEGYTFPSGTTYNPGDTVTLITYWRVDGPQDADLRTFVHILRNPNTEPVAQNDVLSVDASFLGDRDVFIQILDVPLPASFPPGDYFVSVGAYRESTQTRLPIYDSNDERGDRLFLDTVTVKE
jgi:4-amino-4-deoxy-L-arabinose transferase-like glycosyltransferase